jgi:hypothetical protein
VLWRVRVLGVQPGQYSMPLNHPILLLLILYSSLLKPKPNAPLKRFRHVTHQRKLYSNSKKTWNKISDNKRFIQKVF